MNINLMLADFAQAVGNKLYICGGGWSVTGPNPTPGAIAVDIKVPWDERDQEHALRLELLDADGQPVLAQTPHGVQPVVIEATFQVDGPFDGIKPGTPLDAAFAVNYSAIPLAPGGRYEWRLTVNGETDEDWHLAFTTRPVAEAA